eukprot:jgi/Mesen1/10416/ME000818S09892
MARASEDQLAGPLRGTVTELFRSCARYLADDNFIRVAHALETLAVLFREIFRKRFAEQAYTILSLVAGSADHADVFFKRLIADVASLLARDDAPVLVKSLCLRLLLVVLTATGHVASNCVATYLYMHPILDALISVVTLPVPDQRRRLELDATLVLLLLLLWREGEGGAASNAYAARLAAPTAPLLPLLHTARSLLSRPRETRAAFAGPPSSSSSSSTSASFSSTSASSSAAAGGGTPGVSASSSLKDRWDNRAAEADMDRTGGGGGGAGVGGNAAGVARGAYDDALAAAGGATVAAAGRLLEYASLWLGGLVGGTAGGLTGPLGESQSAGRAAAAGGASELVIDVGWSNTSAGLLLIYFLIHLNPAMRSVNMWPHGGFSAGPAHSLASLWGDVFRNLLTSVRTLFTPAGIAGPGGALRAKAALVILRMLLEDDVAGGFLLQCDCDTLMMPPPVPVAQSPSVNGGGGFEVDHAVDQVDRTDGRSVACAVFDLSVGVLCIVPPVDSQLDADLYFRAATLVAVILNFSKSKGRPLGATSVNWAGLWRALVQTCSWCSTEDAFQRPGVAEVAELALGLVEACLGGAALLPPEEAEQLHALVLAEGTTFEALARLAERLQLSGGPTRSPAITGGIKLVNIKEVTQHYEVQVAAMGVRGRPSEAQALEAVRKKGAAGLRLRARHVGPVHTHTEGTSEFRILNGLVRLLVVEHRRHFWASMPKLELESM